MLALALLAAIPLHFHYDASEFTNAVYHVTCLTTRVPCTNSVFNEFWDHELHLSAADQRQLDAWLEIFRKVENAAPAPPGAPLLPNYLSFYPSLKARHRIVAAAVEAHSADDFRRRAAKFLDPTDASRLSRVLQHFELRLHPWWVAKGHRFVAVHTRQVQQQMRTSGLMPLAGQVSAFLEANLPKKDVYIHAIPGPIPTSKDASATVLANHFFVEILASDKPEDTTWKAMHELTHAFYDSAPAARHQALMTQFVAAGVQPAFYTFLNEAVATAVQLLVYEKEGITDNDPYHHPYIPRLGRSTLPLLKEALAKHGSLFEGFTEGYLRAAAAELKEESSSPRFVLAAAGVLASEKNHSAFDMFFERIQPSFYLTTEKEWLLFPGLNGVRLLTYDELPPFASKIPNLESLIQSGSFAYA
ncbi:MAG: hypothetical protein ABI822_03000, partial [Bryobacteraceae bacterium]